ncbi:mechanosensitive ion channel family protein [Amnibacterium endophyticum]|uniref:Mechanosensitive ion channel family protein n=1 Tax=Amnibacterium endophyticum TaxID=2109337 RepID=A0ABW4LHZ0_9MICO
MPVGEVLHARNALNDFWQEVFSLGNDGDWTTAWWGKLIMIALIVIIALVVRAIAHSAIRILVNRIVTGAKRRQKVEDTQALLHSPVSAARTVQRTRTLGSVLNNIVSFVVVVIALLSVVTVINPQITGAFSLITAALGAGLGFGAQNLVKDVLTGLFMVADDQLGVGDIVDTDLATGIVEAVGIRVTQIRDVNGVLWYVRNGELTRVGNRSQGWSRAIVDVTVPKNVDVEAVQQQLLHAAKAALAGPEWRRVVSDVPELWGMEGVSGDGIVIRVVVRTHANARDDVAWSLRTHLREALEDIGVEPAGMSSTRLQEFEFAGSLRGVRQPRTSPVPVQRRRKPKAQHAVEQPLPPAPSGPRTGARGAGGASGASGASGPGATAERTDGG